MLSAAPRPRAPQPISPTLMTSLPAAWTLPNAPRPAAAAVDAFRKSRREAGKLCEGVGSVIVTLLVLIGISTTATATRPSPLGHALTSTHRSKVTRLDATRRGPDPGGSAGRLALDDLRLEALEIGLLVQGPDDPEPGECRIGMPPDALGTLGVLRAAFLVRS